MTLDITNEEKEVLLEMLESASKEALHALHHTDTLDYKDMLKQRLETIDGLKEKVENLSE